MFPSPISFTLLLLAGVASGLLGYLTGLASLISYPVMLAMGLPPILANTSNTVGVVTTGLGSGVGTIRELRETDTGACEPALPPHSSVVSSVRSSCWSAATTSSVPSRRG